MLTQLTPDQLQSLPRTQLWTLCKERGLKCYPKSADCIESILNNQPEKIETNTCANCPLFRPFNDGSGRGLCSVSDTVSRDHHPQTRDCLHLIDEQHDLVLPVCKEVLSKATPENFEQINTAEISSDFQDLLEQVQMIRYAVEDSGDECVNYEDGELNLTAAPESNIYVMWGFDKSETDVVNEILSKISSTPVSQAAQKSTKEQYAKGYVWEGEAWIDVYKVDCFQFSEKLFVYFLQGPEQNSQFFFRTVNSGLLTFRQIATILPTFSSWEVWQDDIKHGFIGMLNNGRWLHAYTHQSFGTPYEAAASLIEAVQLRQAKSVEIQVLETHSNKFIVCNNQNGNHYVVQPDYPDPKSRCECADCHYRGVKCKHQIAVDAYQSKEIKPCHAWKNCLPQFMR